MVYDFPHNYKFDAEKEWNFGLEFDMDKDILTNLKSEMLHLPQKLEQILTNKDSIKSCARKYSNTK